MKTIMILGTLSMYLYTMSAFAFYQEATAVDEITATITANTSKKELEDLVHFLEEHQLVLTIHEQQRNTQKAIIGLSMTLSHGQQQRQYSVSANHPIADLELGAKGGALFINTSGKHGVSGTWSGLLSGMSSNSTIGALMKQFSFDSSSNFAFGMAADSLFFGNNFNFDEIAEKISKQIRSHYNPKSKLFPLQGKGQFGPGSKNGLPKYSFIDQPGIEKLIIIDGHETTFEALDKLAKNDQLETVDFLKPDTAISLYGNVAKDGAIIATTKKQ